MVFYLKKVFVSTYNIFRVIEKLNLLLLITIALVTFPNEHLDIIFILPLIDSLKQKNNGDFAKGGSH